MARQKEEVQGQVMPWNVLQDMLTLRQKSKFGRSCLNDKQIKLIDDMAEAETEQIVQNFLFGL